MHKNRWVDIKYMRVEEEKEENKYCFLGGWEEGLKDFLGKMMMLLLCWMKREVLCMVLPVGTEQQSTCSILG